MRAADSGRREVWVGFPTVQAIVGDKIAPGLLDHYLASFGYSGQQTDQPEDPNRPNNLWEPLPGDHGAHGRFDAVARPTSTQVWLSQRTGRLAIAAAAIAVAVAAARRGRDCRGAGGGAPRAPPHGS